MNIYEKLLSITSEIKNVNKNLEVGVGKNSYKAVGEADVLHAVKQLEQKYKVYSYPCKREIVDRAILETEKELLYGPTLIPIHAYWKNHNFDSFDLCLQSRGYFHAILYFLIKIHDAMLSLENC